MTRRPNLLIIGLWVGAGSVFGYLSSYEVYASTGAVGIILLILAWLCVLVMAFGT